MTHPCTAVLSLALLAPGLLAVQDPLPTEKTLPKTQGLRDSVEFRQQGPDLLAAGWDYAARFDAAGMQFVPALGATVPVEQRLRLRPVAVLRGESVVLDATVQHVTPTAAPNRLVQYQRSAGMTEQFEATPRGVQLSWRFDAQPAGSGDLVVRYRVETNLGAEAVQTESPIRFRHAGVGGVDIGAVTGIDATGKSVAGRIQLAGDVLELALPESFVASAAYPLLLDPLVGSQFAAQTGTFNDSAPDVAYDLTNDLYLVAFRRVFSATSMAVRAQRIAADGTLVGGFLTIASGVQLQNPSVANVRASATFLVAWAQAPSVWEPHDIFCTAVGAATGTLSLPGVVAGDPLVDEAEPDVSGDGEAGTTAMVAYTARNNGIRIAAVSQPAASPTVPTVLITTVATAATGASAPALSKSPSGSAVRVLVWRNVIPGTTSLRARAVTAGATLLGTELVVAQTAVFGGISLGDPGAGDVDGDGTRFLVAYEYEEFGSSTGSRDIYCRGLTWNGTDLARVGTSATAVGQTTTDQYDPAVAWCRYKFLVTFADQFLNLTNNYDVRAVEVDASCTNCGTPMLLSGLNTTLLRNTEIQPAVASTASGGATTDLALLVFSEFDDAPPFESSLVAQRYKALGAGGAVTTVGSGCGTAMVIESNGQPFAAGNTDFAINLRNAPAGSLPFLLLGFPGGETVCGTCVYTNPVSATFVFPTGGTISYPYNLPCTTAAFVGITVQAQWAVLSTPQSPCPLVTGMSFTPRLNLTLGL